MAVDDFIERRLVQPGARPANPQKSQVSLNFSSDHGWPDSIANRGARTAKTFWNYLLETPQWLRSSIMVSKETSRIVRVEAK
jgi:hypothetical protein